MCFLYYFIDDAAEKTQEDQKEVGTRLKLPVLPP